MSSPETIRIRRRGWTALRAEAFDSLQMALQSLVAHKLRAVLTLLGVVVGVFSIIMVMTAIRAMQSNIESELSGLGAYTFTIERWPGITFEGPAGWEKYRRRKVLTLQNALDLRDQATLAVSVAAETGFGSGEVASRFEKTEPDVALTGVTPETFGARNWIVEQGRAIMPGDADVSRNVCVIGSALAKKLFPQGGSPLRETVKFNGISYTVVGVLEAKGGFGGQAQDNFMIIPITTQSSGKTGGTLRKCAARLPAAMPSTTPMTPPSSHNTTASRMNCVSTLRFFAPIARRTPISRVRSVTETSMMFMMPMPAAKSAMELTAAAPIRIARVNPRNCSTSESLEKISKSSSPPGGTFRTFRRMPRTCSAVSSNHGSPRVCT